MIIQYEDGKLVLPDGITSLLPAKQTIEEEEEEEEEEEVRLINSEFVTIIPKGRR